MNILHTECSMNWGGQEFRTALESIYLNQHGHQSWLLCHSDSQLYSKAKAMGATVVGLDLTRAWRVDRAVYIVWFCLRHKVDVINSHGSKDATLCWLSYVLGIPLIRSRQITNPINKTLAYQHGCTHIMAAAAVIKDSLISAGIAADKITVVGEGVDGQQFHPEVDSAYLRTEFGLSVHDKVVVNIGMIREDKGQVYFLEAAKLLLVDHQEMRFFIVGEGTGDKTLEKQLRALIVQYGLEKQVMITGYRDDIAAFTQLADVVVVASIGTEAQSRVVPQAFATRRTVVATNVGGLTELVQHEQNGLVVPPKDAPAMAAAILRLLANPSLQQQFAQRGFEFGQRELSFATMMAKTLALYQRFV